MNTQTRDVIHEVTRASNENRMPFPQVVEALMAVGVERYHTDLIAGRKTYYLPDGETETVPSHRTSVAAERFSAEGVEQALRAIQRGDISYTEFCDRIAAVGCVSYIASLTGRCVMYIGRANDYFIERFPDAVQAP